MHHDWRVTSVLALFVAAASCTKNAAPTNIDVSVMTDPQGSVLHLDRIVLGVRSQTINYDPLAHTYSYAWAQKDIPESASDTSLNRNLTQTPLVVRLEETPVLRGKPFLLYAVGYVGANPSVSGSVVLTYDEHHTQANQLVLTADFFTNDKDHDGFRGCDTSLNDPYCDCYDTPTAITNSHFLNDGDQQLPYDSQFVNPFTDEVCNDHLDNSCSGYPPDQGGQDCGCQQDRLCTTIPADRWSLAGVGICTLGWRKCHPDTGQFDACQGAVGPHVNSNNIPTEVLDDKGLVDNNQLDDNCNGVVDEGAPCSVGTQPRPCFLGRIGDDIGTVRGVCKSGLQSCVCDSGGDPTNPPTCHWANACDGQSTPQRPPHDADERDYGVPGSWTGVGFYELAVSSTNSKANPSANTNECDGYDNDCDGDVDEEQWFDVDNDGYTICGTMDAPPQARSVPQVPNAAPPAADALLGSPNRYHVDPNAKSPNTAATDAACNTLPTAGTLPLACGFTFTPSGCNAPFLNPLDIDCDDDNPMVNPGQTELCSDNFSNACRCISDQKVDVNAPSACGCSDGGKGALTCISNDQECVSNGVDDDAACKFKKGKTCANSDGTKCVSGNCVDGYCCETACNGICQVCSSTPGTCTSIPVGQDPDNECRGQSCINPITYYDKLQTYTTIDGISYGRCFPKADVSDAAATCDGAGACQSPSVNCAANPPAQSPLPRPTCKYPIGGCFGTTEPVYAPIPVGLDPYAVDCAGLGCDGYGSCRHPNGFQCGIDSNLCASGNCVDGVCCNSPCNDACHTCSATPGTCTPIDKGQDTKCNGGYCCSGTCVMPGTGTTFGATCGHEECSSGTWGCGIGNTAQCSTVGHACGGYCDVDIAYNGTCAADGNCTITDHIDCPACNTCKDSGATADCSLKYPDNGTDPNDPNQCLPPFLCNGGNCVKKAPGSPCGADDECSSQHCVDHFCCGVSSCADSCTSDTLTTGRTCSGPGGTCQGGTATSCETCKHCQIDTPSGVGSCVPYGANTTDTNNPNTCSATSTGGTGSNCSGTPCACDGSDKGAGSCKGASNSPCSPSGQPNTSCISGQCGSNGKCT